MSKRFFLYITVLFTLPAQAVNANNFSGAGTTIAVIDSGITLHDNLLLESEYCFLEQSDCHTQKHGHGTHVAGIIASNGKTSPIGIAQRANLVSLRVTDSDNHYPNATVIDNALQYVLENHAQFNVINLSVSSKVLFSGLHCDDATTWTRRTATIIDRLNALNVKVVAATGNDSSNNSISYPACLQNVFAVSASNAWYSNYSPATDFNANGSQVLSTWTNGRVKALDGTSMATAVVSACISKLDEAAGKKVNSDVIRWLSEPWKNELLDCKQLIEDYQKLDSRIESEIENQSAGVFSLMVLMTFSLLVLVRFRERRE